MPSRVRLRRYVGLLAAYAVALQALLSAFVLPTVAVAAAGPIVVICAAGVSDPAGGPAGPVSPGHHHACPACLAGHCAAAVGCERAASFVPWPRAVPVQVAAAQPALLPPARRERLHGPRAPPAA